MLPLNRLLSSQNGGLWQDTKVSGILMFTKIHTRYIWTFVDIQIYMDLGKIPSNYWYIAKESEN